MEDNAKPLVVPSLVIRKGLRLAVLQLQPQHILLAQKYVWKLFDAALLILARGGRFARRDRALRHGRNGEGDDGQSEHRSDGDAYRKYSVAAFYPQWNVAIIEVGYYEGGDVLVVSTSTGSSVTPLAWPHFSPSGKEFASVTSCQAYYCTDGVEIWSTAVDPPTRVYHRDPEADRWYWFGGWGNDGQLNLWVSQVVPPDDSSDDKPPKDAKRTAVVRNAQDWQLMDQK